MKKENFKSDFYETFGHKGFWLYEVINKIQKVGKWKNMPSLFITLFIIPPLILFFPELITRFNIVIHFPLDTIISLFCAAIWSLLGPFCIYQFHQRLIDFNTILISDKDISKDKTQSIFSKALKHFNRNTFLISLVWTFLVITVLIIHPENMNFYGFYGFKDIYFVSLLIYITFLLNLTSCGFYLVIVTVRIIVAFSKESDLIQNILEKNQFGIKVFGTLSFRSTLYFATGLFYFPILINFCRVNNFYSILITLIPIVIYVLFLLYAYIYPNFKICSTASKEKDKILLELDKKYTDLIKINTEKSDYSQQLYMINLYNTIAYVKELSIYPDNVKNIITIFSTTIIPILIFLFDKIDFLAQILPINLG